MPYIIQNGKKVQLDMRTGQPMGQDSGQMPMNGGTQQTQKQPSFLDKLIKAVVKPGVDYGNMAAGSIYEGYRGIKSAMGDQNAYGSVNPQTGKWEDKANPFLNQQEIETFSKPGSAALEGSKRAAGMASYFIPGGKAAEGAGILAKVIQGAKAGAQAGSLYGYSQSQGNNVEDLTADTIKGGVVGGVTGGALSAAGGALSKFKGAKQGVFEDVVNAKVPASPTMVSKKQEIAEELANMGIEGKNAKEIAKRMDGKYKELNTQALEILDTSTKTKSLGRLKAVFKKNLNENGEYFIPDDPRYSKLLDRELTLLQKKAKGGKLTAKDLYDFKNELAGKLNNGFRKEAGDLSSPISDIEGVRLDLWRNLDDTITNLEPGVKGITEQMSVLHRASKGVQKSMEQLKEARPLGIPTGVNLNTPLQNIKSTSGSIMSGFGSIPGATPETAKQLGTTGATMYAVSQDKQTPTNQGTDIAEPSTDIQTPTVIATDPNGEWQTMSDGKTYSMDKTWVFDEQSDEWVPNQQMGGADEVNPSAPMSKSQYNQQLAALAGNSSTAAVRQYGLLQKERDYYYPETKLSVTAQKQLTKFDQAAGIYNEVEKLATGAGTGVGAWFKGKAGTLPGVEGGAEEDLDRTNLALAKGIAGALAGESGVATDEDIKRWLGLMPKLSDTMAERERALERLKNQINMSRQLIMDQQDPQAQMQGSLQDYFSGGGQ